MSWFRGSITWRLAASFIVLGLLVVGTVSASITAAWYVNRVSSVTLQRANLATLGMQIRPESLALINLAQRYTSPILNDSDRVMLETEIYARRSLLNSLIERAVDLTNPVDLSERTRLANIQQKVVNLNLQVNRLIQAFNEEKTYGPQTTLQLEILFRDYEAPLSQEITDFQNYEAERVLLAQAEVTRMLQAALALLGLAAVGAVALTVLTLVWSFKRINFPLSQLHAGVEQLRLGHLDAPVPVQGQDEIGLLSKTFNSMATQLRETLAELRESESRYRDLFENSPISLWEQDFSRVKQRIEVLRQQGITDFVAYFDAHPEVMTDCMSLVQITAVNNATLKLYGAGSKAELLTSLDRIIPPEAAQIFADELVCVASGDTIFDGEGVNAKLSGERLDISLHWFVAPGHEGTLSKVLVALEDITERKRAETELRRVNTLLNMIVENIPNMIFLKDARDLRFVQFNRAGEELLGYSRDELLGKNDYDFFPKEQADFFTEKDRQVLKGHEIVDISEELLQTRYKGLRTLHTKKVTLRNPGGEAEYLLGISEDITERKQAEANERKQRILAESLREVASALNSTLNLDQVLDNILANASHVVPHDMASIMLIDERNEAYVVRERGYAEFGLQEKLLSTRFPLAKIPYLQEVILTAKPVVVSDTASAPGWVLGLGSALVCSWAGIPIRQKDKVIGVINFDSLTAGFFTQDYVYPLQVFADQAALAVTNAQFATQLEEMVAQRTVELAAANRELESLSYNIAHDMRSPVRALVAYSGILQQSHRTQLDGEGLQLLENIHTSGMRLGQMIDSFLTFLHLGHTTVHLRLIDVNELVGHVLTKWEAELNGRQVDFEVGNLPICLADFKLLERVWEQLISNALKFTRHRVLAKVEIGSGEVEGESYYFVRDNGVGLDMKYADKLFGVFQKLHHESEYEGLGIGLAITRRIVQAHGGRMWVEAEVDQGATFYFTLKG